MGLLAPARLGQEYTETIIQDKLRWILEASDPLAVFAFGSAARAEMTEASDIDLALIFEDEKSMKTARKAIYARPPSGTWPADLVFTTRDAFLRKRAAGGLFELIAKEGKLIYGGMA